jgi:hypothetical protein
MEGSISYTIVILLLIGYMAIYLGSRKYLEDFQGSADGRFHRDGSPNTNPNASLPENVYPTQPDVDEYEVSAVFQNQGSREASQQQINDAMTRYPLDWSMQGPNSQHFQENQTKYAKDVQNAAQPAPYSNEGLEAPVPESTEEEERKILQTYQPMSSKDLLTYSVDDVKNLLDRVYDKKGLIPVIHKSKQGENIWEVTEVKEKNPTIVWEDETEEVMRQRGEDTIEVPYPASDLAAGMNPFSGARKRVGNGRNDNPQWTPGVDRMFTPSYPIPAWN